MPCTHVVSVITPVSSPQPFLNASPATFPDSVSRAVAETPYPANATLFMEGQRSQGVMFIVSGRVKLSTTSSDGRTLVVRVAGPGDILGLSATVVQRPYELTAETLEPTRIKVIRRDSVMQWLRYNPELAFRIAQELAEEYHSTCRQLRSMLLSHTASQRLARLLLELAHGGSNTGKGPIRAQLNLTHQAMAEMIGASRETVTRLLASFRHRHIIELNGSTLIIHNREALIEAGCGTGHTPLGF